MRYSFGLHGPCIGDARQIQSMGKAKSQKTERIGIINGGIRESSITTRKDHLAFVFEIAFRTERKWL